MSVDVVSREPVTQHVMYGEWKGYPPGRLNFAAIYFNKQCGHILCRLIRCLENQLLNMSCMESGKNIHLERTTGCQSTSVRHNKRRALGPTGAYRIE